jgi:DNA-binding FadR family transcriptional regulator
LSQNVSAWFQQQYGDRLKIDCWAGSTVVELDGDLYPLQRLAEALENNRLSVGNTDAFIRTYVTFHYVFAQIIGNPAFVALHGTMSYWLLEQRRVALAEPGEDRTGFAAHKHIFEAVSAHDPDAAEAASGPISSGAGWHSGMIAPRRQHHLRTTST